uniref:Uncharacterized protein n=1 Tax=Romanomermis culicivorax TaxID=13658 RepID=A0A915JWI8_ROMCU
MNDCWFFETTRCNCSNLFLQYTWLLTDYNGDMNLPKPRPLEIYDAERSEAVQVVADKEAEESARSEYQRQQDA